MIKDGTVSSELYYAGCEALWRDAKYAVMRRSYALVQERQKALQPVRGDADGLAKWATDTAAIYDMPVTEGADRNALFHVMGYFKKQWSSEERQRYHQFAMERPGEVWMELSQRMAEDPVLYLTTSYIWREDAWNQVWFRYRKRWYLLCITDEVESSIQLQRLSLSSFEDWARDHGPVVTFDDLVRYRMGVRLLGRFTPYQPLWDFASETLQLKPE